MDRAQIQTALIALAHVLHERGITGEMYVVGGAAIALAYSDQRATRDVDAIFEPKMEIYAAAENVANQLGLPANWLNDAVKGFLSPDPDATTIFDMPGLRCMVASPRILLALKVLAHRVGEDEDDIRTLAASIGATTSSEVLAIAEETFADRLTPAARFFVEELFS